MYELGVSDAFGKPTIIMINKKELKAQKKIPFDVGIEKFYVIVSQLNLGMRIE